MTRTAALAAHNEIEDGRAPTEQDLLLTALEEHKRALHWFYNRLNSATPEAQSSNIEQRSKLMAAITAQETSLSRLLNRW